MSTEGYNIRAKILVIAGAEDTLRFKVEIHKVPTVAGAIEALRNATREDLFGTLAEGYGTWNTLTGDAQMGLAHDGLEAHWEGRNIKSIQELHNEIHKALRL